MAYLVPILVIQLSLIGTLEGGSSELFLVLPTEGYCSEQQTGSCKATRSHTLTVDVNGYGSHSFTSSSERFVVLGGVSLNLTAVTLERDKYTFLVSMTYIMEETITITCRNHIITKTQEIVLQSGLCTSPLQYIPSTGVIVWETPTCPGWQNNTLYSIQIEATNSHFIYYSKQNHYVLPSSMKGAINVTVSIENICEEEIELQRAEVNIATISTAGLAVKDSTDGDDGPGALEVSLLTFVCVGIAVPIFLLMVITIPIAITKIKTDTHPDLPQQL